MSVPGSAYRLRPQVALSAKSPGPGAGRHRRRHPRRRAQLEPSVAPDSGKGCSARDAIWVRALRGRGCRQLSKTWHGSLLLGCAEMVSTETTRARPGCRERWHAVEDHNEMPWFVTEQGKEVSLGRGAPLHPVGAQPGTSPTLNRRIDTGGPLVICAILGHLMLTNPLRATRWYGLYPPHRAASDGCDPDVQRGRHDRRAARCAR